MNQGPDSQHLGFKVPFLREFHSQTCQLTSNISKIRVTLCVGDKISFPSVASHNNHMIEHRTLETVITRNSDKIVPSGRVCLQILVHGGWHLCPNLNFSIHLMRFLPASASLRGRYKKLPASSPYITAWFLNQCTHADFSNQLPGLRSTVEGTMRVL